MNNNINWSPGVSLEEVEKQVVIKAFAFYKQNKTATANSLGIAIRTLDSKLEKYGKDEAEIEQRRADERARREEFQRRARGIPQTTYTGRFGEDGSPVLEAERGNGLQPAQELSEKQSVPMQERQEVQALSPRPNTAGHPRKSR